MDSFETRKDFSDAHDRENMSDNRVQETSAASNLVSRPADIVLQPDANGMVVLPEGVSLEDISVQGRDLVIVLDDGTRIVIPEGAIIVPQIVIDGVTVPAANLAALLTGNEPEPAAGNPQSSGGNFEVDPGSIQAAYDLGNLLPYTELQFPQPEEREIVPNVGQRDREPAIVIETPDNPVGLISAVATVDEDGLPARSIDGNDEPEGTRSETDSETSSGTIVFDAPDGVEAVLIDGVPVTTVGQTFEGATGTLTITSIDLENGEIGFTYTLRDNVTDGQPAGTFTMTVVDSDGDRATATLEIRVLDDAPIALDDVDTIDGGTFGPVSGSVLVNDEPGADGYAPEGAVTGFGNEDGTAKPGETLTGTYGELTLEADGSYSYTRSPGTPGGVSDEFTYTITDADGSTSTATLTIDIGDAPAVINSVSAGGDDLVVDEDQLAPSTGTREGESPGSQFDGDAETATGTATFTAPDGVGSITIGGTLVDPDNLPQAVVTDETGTLTVTGYSYEPATGVGTITYVYELTDNTGDTDGTTVTFPIVVTDLDGDSASDDLEITIIDDVPTANDDSADQEAENAPIVINALANDVFGADGVDVAAGVAVVNGTLTGAGTVGYNGDGSFTYTPAAGEEGTVSFDYTITDGDGDTSTATVTITLAADSTPEIVLSGESTVFEEALGARGDEPAGSNESSDGEFASGSIVIGTGGDSVASLVINGVDVTGGGTVTTDRGVLTVTLTDGEYSYGYELTDNTLVDPDADSFTLVVTDSDGDTAQTTLVIDIVDDSPAASDDANSIGAGEYGPVGGNVLVNDVEGADGALVTSYVGANGTGAAGDTIQGEYGTLTIAADGTYSYTRNPGTEGGVSDSFSYTITDGDGDTATANLVIAIADSPVVIDLPVVGADDGTLVDEAGLPTGSDAASDGEFTSGSFTYDAPDGPATVTVGGVPVTTVGQVITGSFGTLTITSIAEGSIGYTYELTTNTDGDDTFDSFGVTVTDQDGDSVSGDLEIAIIDDVPTAVADTDSVTEDGPLTASGNVITNAEANGDDGADTQGADGASVTDVAFGGSAGTVGGATAGAYGSLVLNADGSYTYTLDNTNAFVQGLDGTESLTEVFTYTLTDGDGDTSVTTLTVTINGDDDVVTINGLDLQTPELTVDEDDLADGSSPDPAALTPSGDFTVDSPDGLDTLTVGGVQVWGGGESYPISIPGAYGTVNITGVTVTIDANGDVVSATVSYEYELSDNTLAHMADGEDELVDSLEVVATDSDGSQDTASLDIAVVDDVPTANDDSAGQGAENAPIVIDALANDVFGADGVVTDDVLSVVVTMQGSQGTATYDPTTGLFTYTPTPGAGSNGQLTDSFTYTITDQDGDSSTATVTVNLQPDSEPSGGTVAAAVDDDGLPGGNPDSTTGDLDANAGDDPADTSEASFTGTLTFDVGNDGPATISFGAGLDGSSVMLGGEMVTYSVSGNTLTASSGRGDIFTVEITDPATGEYTVTLLQNVLHAAGNDENDALASIGFTVTDSEGEAAEATLDITFDDDAPTATDNTNSIIEGATVTGNILTDDDGFGLDANGADGTLTIAAVSGAGGSDSGAPFVVTGTYGELTVQADGSYTYSGFPNTTTVDAVDTFTYQIVDADGDIAEATLAINITNVGGMVADDGASVNEAGLAIGSDAASDSEIDADGQITVTGATGTFTYTLTDPAIGNYGTLSLDPATGEYTYTLNSPVDGDSLSPSQGGDNAANTVTGEESFGYVVTDEFGNIIGTGAIAVDIVDDVPTATDQALINVAEDAAPIGGNVVTDGTPDTEGADGASVTAITVGAQTVSVPQDGSDAALTTANGTYTIDMDGNWTFDPNPGLDQSAGAIVADFSYTLTDGDGDTATASQPIRIADGTGPNDPAPISLTISDANLADGSTPTGPDSDSATIDFVAGSDAFDTITFGDTSGLGGGLIWTRVDDFTITGSDGGRLVVTLTLDVMGDDATVTATLNDNYLGHSSQGFEIDALGTVDVVATDVDGDTATGTVSLNVSDDIPTLEGTTPAAGSIEVDETALGTAASADFSGLFTPDYNADGPGGVGSFTLGITGSVTGLVDTASGEAVVATMVNGIIEGRTESGGELVFTVTVDPDGNIELTQNRAVVHADDTNPDDATGLPAELVTLTATVTDGDGDTANATVNIGGAFSFRDDGPAIDAAVIDGDTVTLTTYDDETIGDDNDVDVSTANFGGAFTVASSAYGADGAGSTAWDFSLIIDSAASGLTSDGVPVTLSMNGDVVEGRANGTLVFTVSVDTATGEVTLTQYEEIDHDLPGSDGNYDSQLEALGNGVLSLSGTATITDGDGDTAEETVVLDLGGNIRFADDGPSIDAAVTDGDTVTLTTQDADTVGGADTDVSTANFGGAFSIATSDFGADGPGDIAWSYSLAVEQAASGLSSDGVPVTLSLAGGIVEGSANGTLVFTLEVNATTGEVTLTQYEEIDHALPGSDGNYDTQLEVLGNGLVTLSGIATITDGDGDTAAETVTLDLGGNVRFADDGPTIDASVIDGDTVTLTTQDADTVGGIDTDVSIANFGGAFSVATSSYGADGAGSIVWSYSLTVDQAASNLSSDGIPITLSMNGDVVEGRANGALVFTLEVNETTGAVTLTQYEELDHALPGSDSNYDSQLEALGNGLVTLSGTATITDGDGDTAEETVTLDLGGNVRFADDGPAIDATVVDGDTVTLTTQDADTVGGADTDVSIASFGGAFSIASSDYGADGAGNIAWDYALVIDNPASGLTSGGVPVTLSMNGDIVEGRANGTLVFTAAVNATTGVVTLTQYEVIDHDLPGDTANFDSQVEILADGVLSLSGTATITDGDGDTAEETVSLDLGGNIRFADDGPSADPDTNTLTEDTASVGGNVIADDAFGADGAGNPAVSAVTGFNGASGTVGGSTAGEFGTLTLNGDGTYTYTLNQAAVQGLDTGESEVDSFTYTIVDADGDISTTTLDVTITGANDAPLAENDTNWVLDVTMGADPTTSGNVLLDVNHPGAPSGSFADVADTDVDGDTLSVTGVTGGTVGASLAGTYGAIVINANGTYTYTLDSDNAAVDALGDGETLTDTFTYTVSDGDATDTATVEITIFGTNDAPVVGAAVAAVSDEGLAGGNPDGTGSPTDTTSSATASGTVTITDVDGDSQTVTLGLPTAGDLASGGEPVQWVLQDGGQTLVGYTTDVTNPVVTVTIDNDGDFIVTQYQQIDHPTPGVEDVDSITIPVSSNDGSTTTTNANGIFVEFEDDSPRAVNGQSGGIVDEDALPDGIEGGPGDIDGGAGLVDTVATGSVVSLFQIGGDGDATYSFDASNAQSYLQSLGLSSDGAALTYSVGDNLLSASANGSPVFTMSLSGDGTWEFELLGPLDHPIANTEDDLSIDFGPLIQATDGDGDTVNATGSLTIVVDDDTPQANDDTVDVQLQTISFNTGFILDFSGSISNSELQVQLDAVKSVAAQIFEADPQAQIFVTVFASSAVNLNGGQAFTSLASLEAALDASASSRPNIEGTNVGNLTDFSDAVEAFANSDYQTAAGAQNQVFFLSDGNPNQRGDASNALDSAAEAAWQDFFDQANPPFTITSVGIGNGIRNGPLREVDIDGDNSPIRVSDFTALEQAIIDALEEANTFTGNVTSDGTPDNFGADGPGDPAVIGVTGFNGAAGIVGGSTAGEFGTLTLNADGSYSYVVDPAEARLLIEGQVETETFTYTIADADGDTSTATLVINITGAVEAVPSTGNNATILLDDDALANGNPGGIGDDPDSANTTGTLNFDFGQDGAGSVAFTTAGAPSGFRYIASGDNVLIQQDQGNGYVTVITVALDPVTGDYSATQNLPVLHSAGNDENNQQFTLEYVVTDADGDTANGTVAINVDDDTPFGNGDSFVATVQSPSFQTGFILDFSGSISNSELQTQLNAVKAVAADIFEADPNAEIFVTVFASNAVNLNGGNAFTTLASLEAALNAAASGRPVVAGRNIGNNTNFSAAVEEFTRTDFDAEPGATNQVFFLSDGNPNVRGNSSDALDNAAEATWQNYFNQSSPPFSITAIGVGNGIQNGPLQQVDIDGEGTPILIANFADIQQALIDALDLSSTNTGNVISGEYNGSISGGPDFAGADGPRVLSITVDGRVYTYDGTNVTIPSGGSGTDAGDGMLQGVRTALGGTLDFDFETGDFIYTTPNLLPGGASTAEENFFYQIVDRDGDPGESVPLTIELVRLPALSIGDARAVEGEPIDFEIALSQPSTDPLTVQLSLSEGSATQGVDFGTLAMTQISFDGGASFVNLAANGQFTIPAGVRPDIVVRIPGAEDQVFEAGLEDFQLVAEIISGRTFENIVSGTGQITDDDIAARAITFSTTTDATFHGETISDEDIGRWDGTTASTVFDGDPLFGNNADIDAIHVFSGSGTILGVAFDDGDLLISTKANETLGGIAFAEEDVVLYNISTGTATLVFDGSTVGADGDLDAVSVLQTSQGAFDLIFSMQGNETVDGIAIEDGDLLRYDGSGVTVFFDEDTGFGQGGFNSDADIDAVHVLSATQFIFSTAEDGESIGGLSGIQDGDVVYFDGSQVTGQRAIEVIDEDTFFNANEDIDALDPDLDALEMLLANLPQATVTVGNPSSISMLDMGEPRSRDATTIAASAAAFALPAMEEQVSQTFADHAFAGRDMVNIEFAPVAHIEAPLLPEVFETDSESLVGSLQASEIGMEPANILDGSTTFETPQFAQAFTLEAAGTIFAANANGDPELAGGPSVFGGFAEGEQASAMEALLLLQAPVRTSDIALAEDSARGIEETVSEIDAEAQIDAIVEHFTSDDAAAIAVRPVEGLLDSMIGQNMTPQTIGMAPQDQTDEAAALAMVSA